MLYNLAIAILFLFVIMMAETLFTPSMLGHTTGKIVSPDNHNIDLINISSVKFGKEEFIKSCKELSIYFFLPFVFIVAPISFLVFFGYVKLDLNNLIDFFAFL